MSDDEELFRQEIGDVKPVKKPDRVRNNKLVADSGSKAAARRAAVTEDSDPDLVETPSHAAVSDDYLEMVKPTDILSFKKPGVQDGVYRKLRLGKYTIRVASICIEKRSMRREERSCLSLLKR